MPTIKELRGGAVSRLLDSPFLSKNTPYSLQEAVLDVDVLLSHILKKSRASIIAHLDADAAHIEREFCKRVEERYKGRSIAYIIEEKEFFALSFYVDDSVLIPKRDTELLVEKGIEAVEELLANGAKDACINIMDVFSGSGCVGIALFSSLSRHINAHLTFVDISSAALEVSKKNVNRLLPKDRQTNCSFVLHDASLGLPLCNGNKYNIILANPPYVPSEMTLRLLSDGRGEPSLALDGGEDGLCFFESLAKNASSALLQNSFLLCEVGDGQAERVEAIFKSSGFQKCKAFRDLGSTYRVVRAQKE